MELTVINEKHTVYTIWHSNILAGRLIDFLEKHDIHIFIEKPRRANGPEVSQSVWRAFGPSGVD
jgi:hypothetical protein